MDFQQATFIGLLVLSLIPLLTLYGMFRKYDLEHKKYQEHIREIDAERDSKQTANINTITNNLTTISGDIRVILEKIDGLIKTHEAEKDAILRDVELLRSEVKELRDKVETLQTEVTLLKGIK